MVKGILKCNNCERDLSENEITREHIPARTLFDGYGIDLKLTT